MASISLKSLLLHHAFCSLFKRSRYTAQAHRQLVSIEQRVTHT